MPGPRVSRACPPAGFSSPGLRKRKGGGSLSPNNVRTIKDRRHRAGHSPHPQLFFSPPYFPPLHSGSPHLFFHPPHRAAVAGRGGGGGGSSQSNSGEVRTELPQLAPTRSWLPSVSDQAWARKSTTEVPICPSFQPLSQGGSSPPSP